ncbi:PmoA family protein [Streptomyces sp. NPDC088115]|uniref:DUF6807 domain-containing protein n=1 Tax=Streptomyces sp. NPDC088115 TaxID=3365824 RepID=UPI003816BC0D
MSQPITVTHTLGEQILVTSGGVELLAYVYAPDPDPFEARKPYVHPLRTLAGGLVSGYRPNDHRWHKGLQLAAGHLSGQNFWGGDSGAGRGQGDRRSGDRVGSMRHDCFSDFEVTEDRLRFVERLTWMESGGQEWAAERRTVEVHSVEPAEGAWALDWSLHLINVRDQPLSFGSTATAGDEPAGCTGLHWRGPRDFAKGDVLGPGIPGDKGRTAAAQLMGTPASEAAWIAFTAEHDSNDTHSTVLFAHAPENADSIHASHWFVRSDPFPSVALSWAFFEEFELPPGESFGYRYRVVVADGAWDRDHAEDYLATHRW